MFKNRVEAGKKLARELLKYKNKKPIILAIPRGGVVVGAEIARALNCSLDIVIPRKIGAPLQPELAIGAVAQDGSVELDWDTIKALEISQSFINEEIKHQVGEIKRRMEKYRGFKLYPKLQGRFVILVDDGIATGFTIRAAIRFIKRHEPSALVVAVPLAPPGMPEKLKEDVDEVICLEMPWPFRAIGQFYVDFPQTTDQEVIEILNQFS